MSYNSLILSVDELFLKGRNQGQFIQRFLQHVNSVMRKEHGEKYLLIQDSKRYLITSETPFHDLTLERLRQVPGLNSFALARKYPLGENIFEVAVKEELELLEKKGPLPATFKVFTTRSHKRFPFNSMELNRALGGVVLSAYPHLKVDLRHPQLVLRPYILESGCYLSSRKIQGVGGLPVGSSGHGITLLSGGLDSPVASYLMAKRGLKQDFAFFYSYPFVGPEVVEKIKQLATILSRYQLKSRLYILPFGEIQKKIAQECRPDERTLLFRRSMVEVASLLAKKLGAEALVTGDSLGQVSSQTLPNMHFLDQCTSFPILRPLLGFNKIEIMDWARKIETHDISLLPHDDACSMFASKYPVTRPHLGHLQAIQEKLCLQTLMEECLQKAEIFSLRS